METLDFRNNSLAEIENIFYKNGFNRAKINNFFKHFRSQDIISINDLKGIRGISALADYLKIQNLELADSISDEKGNEKFVFRTFDGHLIESVLMADKTNISICVSVQAGCRLKCSLCQTGRMGLKRNLFSHEILEQIRIIFQKRIYPKRLSCVSFMGMGEPFDNLSNCMLALEWITSSYGYQISKNKCTFSTSGCIDFSDFLSYENLPNLAVSLHSAVPEVRKQMIPASKIPLDKLKYMMILYTEKSGNLISIEYCLINGLNDSKRDADILCRYLDGVRCRINFINYNKTENTEYQSVNENRIAEFIDVIKAYKKPFVVRKSFGIEIAAGCGQLGCKNN